MADSLDRSVSFLLVAAFLGLALLSGCTKPHSSGSDLGASGPTVVKADAFKNADPGETGEIVGRVTDDEVQVLAGASVAITGADVRTETTQDGIFYFQKVPSRTYTLLITKPGYETKNQSVVVRAQERATVEIVLRRVVDATSWTDTAFVFRGHMSCSVRANQSGQNTNPECGAYQEQSDTQRQKLMDLLPGVRWLLIEVQWTSSVPGPNDKLTLGIRPVQLGSWKQIQGPSVLRYMVTPADWISIKKDTEKDYPKLGGQIQFFMFPGESVSQGGVGAGATVEQDFTIYATAWYRMDPPTGFTRIPGR